MSNTCKLLNFTWIPWSPIQDSIYLTLNLQNFWKFFKFENILKFLKILENFKTALLTLYEELRKFWEKFRIKLIKKICVIFLNYAYLKALKRVISTLSSPGIRFLSISGEGSGEVINRSSRTSRRSSISWSLMKLCCESLWMKISPYSWKSAEENRFGSSSRPDLVRMLIFLCLKREMFFFKLLLPKISWLKVCSCTSTKPALVVSYLWIFSPSVFSEISSVSRWRWGAGSSAIVSQLVSLEVELRWLLFGFLTLLAESVAKEYLFHFISQLTNTTCFRLCLSEAYHAVSWGVVQSRIFAICKQGASHRCIFLG